MPTRQDGDEHQNWNDGDILRQQHGKTRPPRARGQPLLLRQKFKHDGCRGQRKAGAENDRIGRFLAGFRRHCGDQTCGQQHLQTAEAKDVAPHRQQTLERQFEPNQKQQKDDAELGDTLDVLGVADREPIKDRDLADERAQAQRAQYGAGDEIAECGAYAQPADDRHQNPGGAEHHQRIAVSRNVDR